MVATSKWRLVGIFLLLACSLPAARSAFDITKARNTWEVVREECKLLGGDLATIKSQNENDEVLGLIQAHVGMIGWDLEAKPNGPLYLIGLRIPAAEGAMSYDGNFEWADGSPYGDATYTNWYTEKWNWNKNRCPDDPPGFPLSKCFLETRGCWPDCGLNDDLLVEIDHGLSWETQNVGSPPGKWSQTGAKGYGVCQLPEEAVTLELDHPNFLFFMSPKLPTFAAILQWCDDNKGLIASVRDEKENYELGSLLEAFNWTQTPDTAQVFIGLTFDDTLTPPAWRWIDGTPFDFENWLDPTEPDNLDKDHHNVNVVRRFGTEKGYPAWRTTGLGRERSGKAMYGVCRLKPADPGFAPNSVSLLSPPGGGVATEIRVELSNFGASNSEGVEVEVAVGDWGLYAGGFAPLSSLLFAVPAGGSVAQRVRHVFEARAQRSVRARVVEGGRYGNLEAGNDAVQLSVGVAYSSGGLEVWVPFGNGGEAPAVVNNTSIRCLRPDRTPCAAADSDSPSQAARRQSNGDDDGGPNDGKAMLAADLPRLVGAPGQGGQATVLAAAEEVVARVEIPVVPVGGLTVVVSADVGGESAQAAISVLQMSPSELLNLPTLCCVPGIEARVLLEMLLLDALEAYEAQDCRRSLTLLRLFVQKAVLLECELGEAAVRCIEQGLRAAVGAGMAIAAQTSSQPPHLRRPALQEASFFERSGLLEAALLQAAKAC